jgi:hypothetical protein
LKDGQMRLEKRAFEGPFDPKFEGSRVDLILEPGRRRRCWCAGRALLGSETANRCKVRMLPRLTSQRGLERRLTLPRKAAALATRR